ncbi:MAG: hypothetical protein L3J34_06500 [Flavobacteriaceae bacterium]|nr:hypothetical protein [Flavobacteriaceae bacterium]
MKKNFLVFLCFLIGFVAFGQNRPKGFKTKIFQISKDTIRIDSLSIHPNYFKVYNNKDQEVDTLFYKVDFVKANLILNSDFSSSIDTIKVVYKSLPEFLTKKYVAFDQELIVPQATDESRLFSYQTKTKNNQFKPFEGLYTSGSLSRGVTIGNNQDAVVNSNFNLQIEGKLSKDVGIRASITDNQVPLQEGGFTQRLDEFDRVYMELFSKNWSLRAGDIDLMNTNSYLMRFQKKISGVAINAKLDHDVGQTNVFASGALVKGKFNSFKFNGIDGNQGPYKIFGPENEQFILMISGSERVYANGVLLKRGENFDYIIDYNRAEITFTTIYTVTSNLRFTIEYQIADRNYTRFLTYDGAEFKSDKLKVGVKYYNESDSKNKTIQQDLSEEQKQILANAGDDQSKMIAPSAVPAIYADNKILYKKSTNNNNNIEIFEYSINPNDDLYQVSFSYVGENRGDYIIETSLATGRVYEFVSEINNVKQGAYLPVIQLVAPESLQIINIEADYNPSENTIFKSEIAFSDKNQNLFSNIDNEDNNGFATKLKWQQGLINKKWQLKSNLDYEYIDANFNTIERIRNVEFSRDWNIDDFNFQNNQKQQFIIAGFNLKNDSIGNVNYNYENLVLGEDYKGNKHRLLANIKLKNTIILTESSVLDNNDAFEENKFYRSNSTVVHQFINKWMGAKYNYENNQRREKASQNLTSFSHKFSEVEGFFGIGDSTKVFAEFGYNYRVTDSVQNTNLENVSKANTFYLKSKLVQNKNTNLALFVNYRSVKNVLIDDEETLNSRVTYSQKLFNNFISLQTLYETLAGNLPQQEFTYIEVEPGKGFYEWIDFNGNEIQELDEFVIAQFQDLAKFVRVLLPTVSFIKTNQNKFSQSVSFNASSWKNNTGFKKYLSHFSNQAYFLINSKTKRNKDQLNLNPFNFDESNLLDLDLNIKNNLFFNRGIQNYSMIYTYINSRKKSIFIFGDQDVKLQTHQFQFINKFGDFWLLEAIGGFSKSASSSVSYANRNYRLDNVNMQPKISYLYSKNSRLEAFYTFKNKENKLSNFETLQMHVFGANYQYANSQKFSINTNINLYFNAFEGNQNSPVAFQMLEGLQPGTNLTWLLNLQKRLTSYLDLNINYFGRKSESSKTIHTGSMQLRASF